MRAIFQRLKRTAVVVPLFAVMAGCASQQTFGNFAGVTQADDNAMARDALVMLLGLYPPASTRFDVSQPAGDPFGLQLLEQLRSNGYAVSESTLPSRASKQATPATPPGTAGGVSLRYIVDRDPLSELYHVTLVADGRPLARVYQRQGAELQAAGNWVRRED